MPTVPQYDEFRVDNRPAGGARQESIASPSLLRQTTAVSPAPKQGSGLDALGKGLFSAGTDVAKIVGAMQDRENADMIFRAETALKDDLIKYHTAASQRLGANAKGVTADTEKWFGDAVQRNAQGLQNPEQQRLFTQEAQKLRLQTVDTMSKHEATQARVALDDSTNASIATSINLAAANASDWTVMEAQKGEIKKRIDVLAIANGKGPEWREQKTGEVLTQLHTQMIQQLVKDAPVSALAYYKKHENEIDGAKRAELGEFAKKATATSLGDGAAGETWKVLGPKNSSDPVELASMEDRVRETLKGNDDAIDKAIKGLRERATAYKDQRKEQANALEASVNGLILKGAGTSQVRNSPEFVALSAKDPEGARKVLTFMENQDYTRVARAAASEARADSAESRAQRRLHTQTLDTTLALSDPDRLVKLSRDEVVNLLPVLGRESTTMLVQRWDTLTKSHDKLIEARIDKQSFDTVADSMGLKPFDPKKSEDEKRMLATVQNRVEAVIDHEQKATGKPLTREAKESLMRREMSSALVNTPTWFGLSSEQRPAIMVPEAELKNIIVPSAEVPKIKAALQSRGMPSSTADVARVYLKSQGAKWPGR